MLFQYIFTLCINIIGHCLPQPRLDDANVQVLKSSVPNEDFNKITHLLIVPKACFCGLSCDNYGKIFESLFQIGEVWLELVNLCSGQDSNSESYVRKLVSLMIFGCYVFNFKNARQTQQQLQKIIRQLMTNQV